MRYLICRFFFFLMIRRPPRSTQSRSSAASDVYKRQYPSCMRSLPRWSSWTRAFINLDSLHTGVHVIHLSLHTDEMNLSHRELVFIRRGVGPREVLANVISRLNG
eukprot:TRINITY_DN896_c0_g1_i3.p2 TRINITY_DN896_c0_g1~~TRINITY_DN896_c0_g1_i3.p2  ORF type:complete len:105 (-),score=35.20 TRINITY_DN896_c0_g1_i3:882-1196(-)